MINKKFMNDKRGDIPVMVLVIGVIALCFLTIMSFSFVVLTLNNSFYGVETMHQMNVFIEEHSFYKNSGMNSEEIVSLFEGKEIQFEESSIYLEEKNLDKVVFSVEYYP